MLLESKMDMELEVAIPLLIDKGSNFGMGERISFV